MFLRMIGEGETPSLSGRFFKILKSLLNGNAFDLSKFKAFKDDKRNMAHDVKSVTDKLENSVGKGRNASYEHFLQGFLKCPFSRTVFKTWELLVKDDSFMNT